MVDFAAAAERLAAQWRARGKYQRLDGALRPADLAEAYAIQRHLHDIVTDERGPIAGYKIALSSKAMQEMVGIDRPLAGAIFANDVHKSPAIIRRADFCGLGLEYELAFEMADDAAPSDAPFSAADAVARVTTVRPAFELIEDRQADYADLCVLTLASDNAWCGGIVLGEEITDWRSLDLGDLPAILHQDGEPPEAANTGAADPLASLAWVLNHVTGAGQTVRTGQQIITGSVLRTRFPKPGDTLRYEVNGQASVAIEVV